VLPSKTQNMKINEIFLSIQGEGRHTGLPTVFIRLTGCNLRCSYCDTGYAYNEGTEYTIKDILSEIEKYNYKRVCITGGEPLLNTDINVLLKMLDDYDVSIETNGSIDISRFNPGSRHTFIMDIKTPSSGECKKNITENMNYLRDNDEIKAVIGDRKDYIYTKDYINKYYKKGNITFSAVYDKMDNKELISWILEDRLDIRFQIQLHKYIWGANERGR
jgi:7-carboxy-7-deazaguanine synthase